MINEVFDVVYKLNQEIYESLFETCGEIYPVFELHTDGNIILILIGSHQLWNSEDDEREYIDEDKDEYEPLEQYLRREVQKIINTISNIKLIKE